MIGLAEFQCISRQDPTPDKLDGIRLETLVNIFDLQ